MEEKDLIVGRIYELTNYKNCYYIGFSTDVTGVINNEMSPINFKKTQKYFLYLGTGKNNLSGFIWFLANDLTNCYFLKNNKKYIAPQRYFINNIKELIL